MAEGRDLIVQAHTGSGKTGAFGIPIVSRLDTSIASLPSPRDEPNPRTRQPGRARD